MSDPLVSCITPTYGRSHLLPELLFFWLTQNYKNKELIIVNDEPNLVIEVDYDNVRVFNFQERFIGLGAKRNFCVEQVHPDAKYILPFDDDDIFLPNHIDSLLQGFNEDPLADITKNSRHFMVNDNVYAGIKEGEWPFFGASCFKASSMSSQKFKDNYVMGEDVDFITAGNFKTHVISSRKPTFGYRAGMNIVHASGHKVVPTDAESQLSLHERIGNSVKIQETEVELNIKPKLSYMTNQIYRELINKQLWT